MTRATEQLQIRWMIRRDMQEVYAIERQCFSEPWTEDEFLQQTSQRNVIGCVAEIGNEIVGYMIYELHKGNLNIINLAVKPDRQRQGIGTAMIDGMKLKLSSQRRTQLWAAVSEVNLVGQLFFQKQRFVAIEILREFHGDRDAYDFCFEIPAEIGATRITQQ